jgi:hypothetical protein
MRPRLKLNKLDSGEKKLRQADNIPGDSCYHVEDTFLPPEVDHSCVTQVSMVWVNPTPLTWGQPYV